MRQTKKIVPLLMAIAFAASPAGSSAEPHIAGKSSPQPVTDLRSPDARDAAVNPVTTYEPGHVATNTPRPIVQISDGGFSWSDAGIGAAGALGLLALLAGTGLVMSQRRHRRMPAATN